MPLLLDMNSGFRRKGKRYVVTRIFFDTLYGEIMPNRGGEVGGTKGWQEVR